MSIFLCYRRSDSRHATGRIHDWLELELPDEKVIRDVDELRPGSVSYRAQLQDALSACEVFILVIASSWLGPRLAVGDDVLREEIERALALGITIIPVLIDDASMPDEAAVPESIRGFLKYQSVHVRSERSFKHDVKYLIESVEKTLAEARKRRRAAMLPEEFWAFTRSPHPVVRKLAASALAEMLPGDESGGIRSRLREMMADPDPAVANCAMRSLGESVATLPDVQYQAEGSFKGVEDALDEAEFFVARGLHEDAKAALLEQLTRTPNHPLVLERLHEVGAALEGLPSTAQTSRSDELPEEPLDYDVLQSLAALDEMDPAPGGAAAGAHWDIDVDQVFEKFRAGIRSQLSENDSAAHYDLGLAYKDMGLIADAVEEFEVAARNPQRECACYEMIGNVYSEEAQLDRAIEAYVRALSAAEKTVEQEMNAFYGLGIVYEMKGQRQDALHYFQKIARRYPGYRDVSERLIAFKGELERRPVSTSDSSAVVDPDEFDRVFDDLFEGRGKGSP